MKIVKLTINILMTIIIGLGVLFLILYLFGIVPYVTLSGSMEPTVETGSLCFIDKKAKLDSVEENDIIAFRLKDGTLVTHRAIKITDSGIITKGDNNKDADSNIVSGDSFVGKNLFSIPRLGYVVKAFQSITGKIIIITFVVLLFVSGFLFGENKKVIIKK
jgi:signal peptidase